MAASRPQSRKAVERRRAIAVIIMGGFRLSMTVPNLLHERRKRGHRGGDGKRAGSLRSPSMIVASCATPVKPITRMPARRAAVTPGTNPR